ncbi:MAG TPA: hypothetical protein VG797_05030 [Phycisphaerales bacterium]|nr:hypothetical protein [Phycisphaerales bacterium]
MRAHSRLRHIALAVLIAFLAPLIARAQPSTSPSSPAPQASRGEVQLTVETLGVGGTVRPGDWAGIRVAVNDSALQPRNIAVRIDFKDADGDTIHNQRLIVSSPGQPVGTWLYAFMPTNFTAETPLSITANEVTTVDETPRLGRRLGRLLVTPSQVPAAVTNAENSMIGVVGRATLGLDQYAATFREQAYSPSAHEITRIVSGLLIDQLHAPDAWLGWAAYEALVWVPGSTEVLGTEFGARALREWVNRGGHLIIVAPPIGTAWRNPAGPLADLLPTAAVERIEDADLEPYRALLTNSEFDRKPLPTKTVLHRFVIADDTPIADAAPIISGPHGCVVCRRLVGTGMVTVIGLDLTNRQLHAEQMLRADAFWNRILGRRADTPTPAVLEKHSATAQRLQSSFNTAWVDRSIGDEISRTRTAGAGIAVALSLFIVYCLAFGAGGQKILDRFNLSAISWPVAAGSIAIWTIATWALATSLRPKDARAWHLTILDHVYGQPVQRARTWAGVLLPTYGEQTVSVGEPNADQNWQQSIAPWTDPENDTDQAFPDSREYEFDVRAMNKLTVPTRSTIKQFRMDWVGGPRLSTPGPANTGFEPRLDAAGRVSGKLVHKLPEALHDVHIILVTGQKLPRTEGPQPPGRLASDIYIWSFPTPSWLPETELDLAQFSVNIPAAAAGAVASKAFETWMSAMRPNATGLPELIGSPRDFPAINFFPLLPQPDYTREQILGLNAVNGIPQRRLVHTLDLAKWTTESCLIITGTLDDSPSPVPIMVDDQMCPSQGRTLVRWIYPLTPNPIRFGG